MMNILNNYGQVGKCIEYCSSLCSMISNKKEYKDILDTLILTRSTLSNFMRKSSKEYSFLLFISEIEHSLEKIMNFASEKTENRAKVIDLDYLLKQQMEQINFEYVTSANVHPISLVQDLLAKKFWLENFGKERLIEKSKFMEKLKEFIDDEMDNMKKELIEYYLDFTDDGFISVFDFQKFLTLFGDFNKVPSTINEMYNRGIRIFKISSKRANSLLQKKIPGDYLLRFSKSQSNSLAITYIDHKKTVKNSLILITKNGIQVNSNSVIYPSLSNFLSSHKSVLKNAEDLSISFVNSFFSVYNNKMQNKFDGKSQLPSNAPKSNSSSKSKEEEEEENGDYNQISSVCVCCLKSQRDSVMDCKHFICCYSCSVNLKECPLCKAPNYNPIQIYVS